MQKIIQVILDIPQETQNLEFKRLDGKKIVAKVAETIVAMANTEGGSIIIGVDDPEKTKLKGLDRIFGIEENIELFDEIIHEVQRAIPPVVGVAHPTKIKVEEVDKTIAIIDVPKATECFHAINNHVYMRLHKSNKRLTPQEYNKMSYAKGFEKADRELVSVDFDLLDTAQYKAWRGARGVQGDIKEALFKTGLARKDSKDNLLPTRAAVLLFADYPTNLMETKCTIRALQYTGRQERYQETPNLVGKPVTIEGPLVQLIAKAHEYVLTILRAGIEIHSGFLTKYQIPERAVKEAITNAVIHRDYHIKRDIEIKIFEDRITVKSPGLFPYNITRRNIGLVRADGYRNDLLVKHLREFPEPPNLDQNEGVRAMQNAMKTHDLYPPVYITYPNYEDSVEVSLFNENRPDEWEKVRQDLLKNKYIKNDRARIITGVDQRDKMSRLLSKWVKQGLLLKIQSKPGDAKNTRYKLATQPELDEDE